MVLKLYNTLTRSLQKFKPADGDTVRMYSCGPTVYNYVHIGNLRTFTFQDILRRYLRHCGWKLRHVMNITDVDDKIIANATLAGQSIEEYTAKYRQGFEEDCAAVRLETPEKITLATEYIPQMIEMIGKIGAKGYTYQSDGSTYFRIAGFDDYGKLSRIDTKGMKAGARVDNDEYEKDDARDFALWKGVKEGEPSWDSPFGKGRPGWHIECSAMAVAELGDSFDIHTGGVDLTFPHHENEIAQSEAASGKPFVRFWVHGEHLLVEGQKMSKSLGNFFTLRDLLEKGFSAASIRYLLSTTPHRKQLNFTFDGLKGAAAAIGRLRSFKRRLESTTFPDGANPGATERAKQAIREFEEGLDDDLNTAQAVASVFEYVRDVNTAIDAGNFRSGDAVEASTVLKLFDSIFDVLKPDPQVVHVSPATVKLVVPAITLSITRPAAEEIDGLIAQRAEARKARDFALSDQIRDDLKTKDVIIEDTRDGASWHYADE
jgi:cysteinyl-tRNA synthetase